MRGGTARRGGAAEEATEESVEREGQRLAHLGVVTTKILDSRLDVRVSELVLDDAPVPAGGGADFFDLCRTTPAPGRAAHPGGTCNNDVSMSDHSRPTRLWLAQDREAPQYHGDRGHAPSART